MKSSKRVRERVCRCEGCRRSRAGLTDAFSFVGAVCSTWGIVRNFSLVQPFAVMRSLIQVWCLITVLMQKRAYIAFLLKRKGIYWFKTAICHSPSDLCIAVSPVHSPFRNQFCRNWLEIPVHSWHRAFLEKSSLGSSSFQWMKFLIFLSDV
jgi:hypothetical protein